jgi:hypothetical protein
VQSSHGTRWQVDTEGSCTPTSAAEKLNLEVLSVQVVSWDKKAKPEPQLAWTTNPAQLAAAKSAAHLNLVFCIRPWLPGSLQARTPGPRHGPLAPVSLASLGRFVLQGWL